MTTTSERPPWPTHDVFSAQELAGVAGVPVGVIHRLVAAAEIPTLDGEFIAHDDALAAARDLRLGLLTIPEAGLPPGVFGAALYRLTYSAVSDLGDAAFCERYCGCAERELQRRDLFDVLMGGDPSETQMSSIRDVTRECSFRSE